MSEKPVVKVGYWKCRGYLSPIILMLEHLGLSYEVHYPQCGPPPIFGKTEWYANKHKILKEFDFPNLPYFDDGQVKLTHTLAILEYLDQKLEKTGPVDPVRVAILREQGRDLGAALTDYIYLEGRPRVRKFPHFCMIKKTSQFWKMQ